MAVNFTLYNHATCGRDGCNTLPLTVADRERAGKKVRDRDDDGVWYCLDCGEDLPVFRAAASRHVCGHARPVYDGFNDEIEPSPFLVPVTELRAGDIAALPWLDEPATICGLIPCDDDFRFHDGYHVWWKTREREAITWVWEACGGSVQIIVNAPQGWEPPDSPFKRHFNRKAEKAAAQGYADEAAGMELDSSGPGDGPSGFF